MYFSKFLHFMYIFLIISNNIIKSFLRGGYMQEIEILKEINKDSKMGMDSITMVNKKVQDEKLKELLDTQHNEYQNIFDRSQELLIQNNETIEVLDSFR